MDGKNRIEEPRKNEITEVAGDLRESEDTDQTGGIESAEDITEKKAKSIIRRISIIAIGLFLIILITSLSVMPYILGVLGSQRINEGRITGDDYALIFNEGTYEKLLDHYKDNEGREIHACLKGNKKGRDYEIQRIYFPEVNYADVHRISTQPCDEETLIDLHSHPMTECRLSEQDIKYAQSINWIDDYMIMCSHDRFALYEIR